MDKELNKLLYDFQTMSIKEYEKLFEESRKDIKEIYKKGYKKC